MFVLDSQLGYEGWLTLLTGSQGQEDDDGSEGEEESGAEVEGESGVGVAVGVVAGVGVVVVLLRVASSSGGLSLRDGRLCLTFGPHTGQKEESEGNSEHDLSHHFVV
jgi:hypothetical protein